MRKYWLFVSLAILIVFAGGYIAFVGWASPTETRMKDLSALNSAIQRFKVETGAYPVADGWFGRTSQWGKDTEEYVPGLVPKYIEALPQDPESDGASQYFYSSNGLEYKIIAFRSPDCEQVRGQKPEMVDPARAGIDSCIAYGYWTSGAASW